MDYKKERPICKGCGRPMPMTDTEKDELQRREFRERKKKMMKHIVVNGVCPCGSGHNWELAKHGFCTCSNPHCPRVHRPTSSKQEKS